MNARFSLRDRKYAATKKVIFDEVVKQLADKTLDDVAVKQVCEQVQISEATFFNYFPSKADVMAMYAQLWMMRVGWYLYQSQQQGSGGLETIKLFFEQTAAMMVQTPGVMNEFVIQYARRRHDWHMPDLTGAELALHFPEFTDVAVTPMKDAYTWLLDNAQIAMAYDELPEETDVAMFVMLLMNVLIGTPIMLQQLNIEDIHVHLYYEQQVQMIVDALAM